MSQDGIAGLSAPAVWASIRGSVWYVVVRTGLDRLAAGEFSDRLAGRRVGLLCHPASVTADLVHAVSVLGKRADVRALFGPEHGVAGHAQDMVGVASSKTELPVFSLYGTHVSALEPTPAALDLIDLLVCDLVDIGCRYYTFAWTLLLCLRACARARVPVLVLDRPNPLGGERVEGPGVEPGYESFVGLCSLPVRHGLTIGEFTRFLAPKFAPTAEFTVVPMGGWQRSMSFEQTGLPWVLPSPNMPTVDTTWVYPGQCLLEGTNVSEGRGTTRPFEIFGAPYIDGERLAQALGQYTLPGVQFRALSFCPTFHKWSEKLCGGVQLHVADQSLFCPLRTTVAILHALHRLWPEHFAWRNTTYEFVSDRLAIDLLSGSPRLREMIDAGASVEQIVAPWAAQEETFAQKRQPALLYS